MIRASALYMAIIVALVVGVICAALVGIALFYRLNFQEKQMRDRMSINLSSAINLALTATSKDSTWQEYSQTINDGHIRYRRQSWGIYDYGIACSYRLKDTLASALLIGNLTDTAERTALYVCDEDRPISVGGKSEITGDAYIPKAGIQEVYLNDRPYQGKKKIISGMTRNSKENLPSIMTDRLGEVNRLLDLRTITPENPLPNNDSLVISFHQPTKIFNLAKNATAIRNVFVRGNILILSDTTLTLDSTVHADGIILAAKSVIINKGFKGNLQIFATDSIHIAEYCTLSYPSCAGVIDRNIKDKGAVKLFVGKNSSVDGTLFTYTSGQKEKLPVLELSQNTRISGEVCSAGVLLYNPPVKINGRTQTVRFMMKSNTSIYENYLFDMSLNRLKLSPYYLSGFLVKAVNKSSILRWLDH